MSLLNTGDQDFVPHGYETKEQYERSRAAALNASAQRDAERKLLEDITKWGQAAADDLERVGRIGRAGYGRKLLAEFAALQAEEEHAPKTN